MGTPRNTSAWSVTVDVADLSVQIGQNQVTATSEHHFDLENKSGDTRNFQIHYSLDLYEGYEDNDGNMVWTIKGFEDENKPFAVPDDNVVYDQTDAEVEPQPNINYLLATACNKRNDRQYYARAYTHITPPNTAHDWKGDDNEAAIEFSRQTQPVSP